jgi:hypothetical protein
MCRQSSRASLSSRLDKVYLVESTLTVDSYMWTINSRFYGSWLDLETIKEDPLGRYQTGKKLIVCNRSRRSRCATCSVMFESQCIFLKCCKDVFRHQLYLRKKILFLLNYLHKCVLCFLLCSSLSPNNLWMLREKNIHVKIHNVVFIIRKRGSLLDDIREFHNIWEDGPPYI